MQFRTAIVFILLSTPAHADLMGMSLQAMVPPKAKGSIRMVSPPAIDLYLSVPASASAIRRQAPAFPSASMIEAPLQKGVSLNLLWSHSRYRHALHAKRDDQQVLGIEGPARILTRQSASAAKPLLAQSGRCVR